MGKMIYRTEKVSTPGEVSGIEREANRTQEDIGRFQNSDINWELTDNNYSFKTTHGWVDAAKEKCKELGCPVKKDSVLVLDHLITASPEWMWEQTEETRMQFFEDAKNWIVDEFCGGDESLLLNCVVHKDESNWHLAAATIPIMKNKQRSEEELAKLKRKPRQKEYSLNAKAIMGGRSKYGSRQQSIEDRIGKKYGLEEREIREQGQAKKHRSVQQAKLEAAKEQVKEVEKTIDAKEKAVQFADKVIRQKQKDIDKLDAEIKNKKETAAELSQGISQIKQETHAAIDKRIDVQHQLNKEKATLGVVKARTSSELHKQEKVMKTDVMGIVQRDALGRLKSRKFPGGNYYDIAQGDYDKLERHVNEVSGNIEKVEKADFAGKEAVEQLQDLLKNEKEYIQTRAKELAKLALLRDQERMRENKEKKQQLSAKETELQAKEADLLQREAALTEAITQGIAEALRSVDISDLTKADRFMEYLNQNYESTITRALADFNTIEEIRSKKAQEQVKNQTQGDSTDDHEWD